jgi:hypothetical protein
MLANFSCKELPAQAFNLHLLVPKSLSSLTEFSGTNMTVISQQILDQLKELNINVKSIRKDCRATQVTDVQSTATAQYTAPTSQHVNGHGASSPAETAMTALRAEVDRMEARVTAMKTQLNLLGAWVEEVENRHGHKRFIEVRPKTESMFNSATNRVRETARVGAIRLSEMEQLQETVTELVTMVGDMVAGRASGMVETEQHVEEDLLE